MRYVYYCCSKAKDMQCKEPYIREEALIEQLLDILDKVSIDKIGARERLEQEIGRYKKFAQVLGQNSHEAVSISQVDIRNYAKYVLREGSREEKREVLGCLKSELYVRGQKVHFSAKSLIQPV